MNVQASALISVILPLCLRGAAHCAEAVIVFVLRGQSFVTISL